MTFVEIGSISHWSAVHIRGSFESEDFSVIIAILEEFRYDFQLQREVSASL